ncbi:hypothetical protein L218DRAFT_414956 [Marasmius fiardii PR-910]|nr:hypothetical protein L218DRAFT_414956 [Marasmius fiardii PR-910]
MRFTILKKWSHIIHRRGKSDSHLHFLQPTTTQVDYPRSISAGNINTEIAIVNYVPNLSSSPLSSPAPHAPRPSQSSLKPSALPPVTPRLVDLPKPPYSSRKPRKPSSTTSVAHKIALTKRRISQLEEEKESLDTCIKDLKISRNIQQKQLEQVTQDLQSSRAWCQTEKNRIRELDSHVQRDYQRQLFANALLELGLSGNEVGTFLDASEEEIVGAILEAAERDDNVWCSVLSEIIGPLAPDNYVSAVNIALNTRKELRSARKVARFWKRTANVSDMVTPSTSNLSDSREPLSLERRQAVERLQRRRRGLSIDLSAREQRTLLPSASVSSEASTALPYLSSAHSITSLHKRDSLPPLASQVFREEFIKAYASSSLFTSSSSKQILKPTVEPTSEDRQANPRRLSQKTLGKGRGVLSAEASTSVCSSSTIDLCIPTSGPL